MVRLAAKVRNEQRRGRARRFRPADLPAMLGRKPPAPRGLKVLLAGKLTALAAPGGGETQLLALASTLPEVGVEARLWRPWEHSLCEADLVHLVGSQPEHLPVALAARRAGVRVVLSTIAWFDLASLWREPRPLAGRLAAGAKFLARAACPRVPSWRRRLYHAADLLLPNSAAEAEQLGRFFRVPPERIRVVPNGAHPRFARATPEAFFRRFGLRDFVLYAGRIEPRKNQLAFLRALRHEKLPIVVLGDAVPGHEPYLNACRRAAGPNVTFLPALAHDDPLLASAYAAARCLVLASWFETPGLVALEAGMLGVPLVLPTPGCAAEYFGDLAAYVRPDDLHDIRAKVLAASAQPRNPALARFVRETYTWHGAARHTRAAYEHAMRGGS